ncbi:Uncharacterized membrane anchored protein MROS_1280 [hydrothermal vent metagenome]|uniref:Uncharacterized membrane anchored protein MROS_1280 n=1 Tax=hydrothermal vent metagenome TaxID=652676 RepID=A0A3B1E3K2_9ZZZZ
MNKIKSFFITTFLGGVTVILPVAILLAVFGWLFNFITGLIQPLTNVFLANSDFSEILADGIVILIILAICFFVGVFIRTSVGKWFYTIIEANLLKALPGYTLIKETVLQLIGNKKSPFSSVALAQIFDNDTLVTCFVTEEHDDGSFSVFVPTGPNPTSGNIYHLKKENVHPIDVSVEDAMRSIISCGAGSDRLIKKYRG